MLFRSEALALLMIANLYDSPLEKTETLRSFTQALSLYRSLGDRKGESDALIGIARLERDLGNLAEARNNAEAALAIIESLRTKIISPELRTSYFATVQNHYQLYVDILMRMHKQHPTAGLDGEALQASERARARSLLELLNEAHADIRQGVDRALLERERLVQQLLDTKAELGVRLPNGTYTAEQRTATAKEIEGLTTEYQEVEAKIRQTSPRYAALTQPKPASLKEMQQALDSDTLLLEYSLGSKRSYLWLVSPNEIKSYELPTRSEIESTARSFYELLNTPNRIYAVADQKQAGAVAMTNAPQDEMLGTASRLSQMLLGPVASQLGQKRLVIVADGALQYLPFAALPDPASVKPSTGNLQPLIVGHEIVSLPSVSILATLRSELGGRKPAPQDVAVLADPVFYMDDERVKHAGQKTSGEQTSADAQMSSLAEKVKQAARETRARRDGNRLIRLKGTRKEAEEILALVPSIKAKKALDFEASRSLVTSGELSQYRYVHFATHGLLDSIHPELTAIVLSLVDENGNPQDGFLRAHEIYNLNLPADVVVLSGCQTGLGKEVKGEGLIGLTRGFMYAGAARVVISLWSVDDEATAELMVRFYRGMLKEGKRPVEALRAAQIEMMKQPRWQAPHYWAAFVLQGEWK